MRLPHLLTSLQFRLTISLAFVLCISFETHADTLLDFSYQNINFANIKLYDLTDVIHLRAIDCVRSANVGEFLVGLVESGANITRVELAGTHLTVAQVNRIVAAVSARESPYFYVNVQGSRVSRTELESAPDWLVVEESETREETELENLVTETYVRRYFSTQPAKPPEMRWVDYKAQVKDHVNSLETAASSLSNPANSETDTETDLALLWAQRLFQVSSSPSLSASLASLASSAFSSSASASASFPQLNWEAVRTQCPENWEGEGQVCLHAPDFPEALNDLLAKSSLLDQQEFAHAVLLLRLGYDREARLVWLNSVKPEWLLAMSGNVVPSKSEPPLRLISQPLRSISKLYRRLPYLVTNSVEELISSEAGTVSEIRLTSELNLEKCHQLIGVLGKHPGAQLKLPQYAYGETLVHLGAMVGHTEFLQFYATVLPPDEFQNQLIGLSLYDTLLTCPGQTEVLNYLNYLETILLPGELKNKLMRPGLNGGTHTPVHWAAARGYTEVLKFIATVLTPTDFKKVLVWEESAQGLTPIHLAVAEGDKEVLTFVLSFMRKHYRPFRGLLMKPNAKRNGETLFQFAAMNSYLPALEVIAELLSSEEFETELLKLDDDGATLIHFAAQFGHTKILEFIATVLTPAKFKSELIRQNKGGWTPVCLAGHQGHRASFEYLYLWEPQGYHISSIDTDKLKACTEFYEKSFNLRDVLTTKEALQSALLPAKAGRASVENAAQAHLVRIGRVKDTFEAYHDALSRLSMPVVLPALGSHLSDYFKAFDEIKAHDEAWRTPFDVPWQTEFTKRIERDYKLEEAPSSSVSNRLHLLVFNSYQQAASKTSGPEAQRMKEKSKVSLKKILEAWQSLLVDAEIMEVHLGIILEAWQSLLVEYEQSSTPPPPVTSSSSSSSAAIASSDTRATPEFLNRTNMLLGILQDTWDWDNMRFVLSRLPQTMTKTFWGDYFSDRAWEDQYTGADFIKRRTQFIPYHRWADYYTQQSSAVDWLPEYALVAASEKLAEVFKLAKGQNLTAVVKAIEQMLGEQDEEIVASVAVSSEQAADHRGLPQQLQEDFAAQSPSVETVTTKEKLQAALSTGSLAERDAALVDLSQAVASVAFAKNQEGEKSSIYKLMTELENWLSPPISDPVKQTIRILKYHLSSLEGRLKYENLKAGNVSGEQSIATNFLLKNIDAGSFTPEKRFGETLTRLIAAVEKNHSTLCDLRTWKQLKEVLPTAKLLNQDASSSSSSSSSSSPPAPSTAATAAPNTVTAAPTATARKLLPAEGQECSIS